jgi:hypothetical protein
MLGKTSGIDPKLVEKAYVKAKAVSGCKCGKKCKCKKNK